MTVLGSFIPEMKLFGHKINYEPHEHTASNLIMMKKKLKCIFNPTVKFSVTSIVKLVRDAAVTVTRCYVS